MRRAEARTGRSWRRWCAAPAVGLPAAIGVYFWANRLLPVQLVGRADWEVHCLFLAWLGFFVHAVARPTPRGGLRL